MSGTEVASAVGPEAPAAGAHRGLPTAARNTRAAPGRRPLRTTPEPAAYRCAPVRARRDELCTMQRTPHWGAHRMSFTLPSAHDVVHPQPVVRIVVRTPPHRLRTIDTA